MRSGNPRRDEVRRGRIDYLGFSRRYRLNGGLDSETRSALLTLGLADDRASLPTG